MRLIDADELMKSINELKKSPKLGFFGLLRMVEIAVEDAPTVEGGQDADV